MKNVKKKKIIQFFPDNMKENIFKRNLQEFHKLK